MTDWLDHILESKNKKTEVSSSHELRDQFIEQAAEMFKQLKAVVSGLVEEVNQRSQGAERLRLEEQADANTFFLHKETPPVLRTLIALEAESEAVFFYLDSLSNSGTGWDRRRNERIGLRLGMDGRIIIESKYGDSVDGAAREVIETMLKFDS